MKENEILKDIEVILHKTPTYLEINSGYYYINSYQGFSKFLQAVDQKEVIAIVLGEQIKKIVVNAFRGFPNLQAVFYNEKLSMISDNAFQDCKKLDTFVLYTNGIARSLKEGHDIDARFGKGTFEIAESIDSIGKNAFKNTAFSKVEILKDECKIGTCAFADCFLLRNVSFKAKGVKVQKGAFFNCPKLKFTAKDEKEQQWFDNYACANPYSNAIYHNPKDRKYLHGLFKKVEHKSHRFEEEESEIY